jgi:hypothetical protein
LIWRVFGGILDAFDGRNCGCRRLKSHVVKERGRSPSRETGTIQEQCCTDGGGVSVTAVQANGDENQFSVPSSQLESEGWESMSLFQNIPRMFAPTYGSFTLALHKTGLVKFWVRGSANDI